jgi:hypothetical protein
MAEAYTAEKLLAQARSGLRNIGYRDELLCEKYQFADIIAPDQTVREIALAAFAQEPTSYLNACIGIAVPKSNTPKFIENYRTLGSPQIFSLHPLIEKVLRWKIPAHGEPVLLESIEPAYLQNAILSHKDEWNPERVLRAKSIRFSGESRQLDFFDLGFLPALEELVHKKLDQLFGDVLALCKSTYLEYHDTELDYQALYRLIFRLVASKLLGDREYPGDWLNNDVHKVIKEVEQFYSQHTALEPALDDIHVQNAAWQKIRAAFSFQNLSVEALAYVYENTFVSQETRKRYGTHATPPEIAEYIVQSLPFEELPQEQRHVFEPFCGHAPFLTAALGRLRTLLPSDLTSEQRHSHFIEMLSGMELDAFACEIARYSLILADYPNPNGWHIENNSVFVSPDLDKYVAQAQVVLCNPPFENFSVQERAGKRSIKAANKAVEALRRVLQHPPQMLGFILPRVFADGQSYRDARKQITSLYGNIALVELPDSAFNYSDAETVLLLAHGQHHTQRSWHSIWVDGKDYPRFIQTGEPTSHIDVPASFVAGATALWYNRLQSLWDRLAHLPRLGDITEIHRGIEYNLSFKKYEAELVSDSPRKGFAKGLRRVTDDFEPYTTTSFTYLNMNPQKMLYEAYKRSWDKPKVIANAARLSIGPWTMAAIIDEQGLVCYQRFHGIWSKGELPLEVIAALLNSPIANAFLGTHRTSRDNKIETIRQIPIPKLNGAQRQRFGSLVREYISYREQWRSKPEEAVYFEGRCLGIMRQLEAELLAAYDLPPDLERELLRYFDGYKRPGPVNLTRVSPSSTKKLYTAFVRVENIKGQNGSQTVEATIASWDPYQIVQFPLSLIPEYLQGKLEQDILLVARVNIGAKKAEDLIFENFELVQEPVSDERFA